MRHFDELWPGGPAYRQKDGVFKLGSDSVLLADFVNMSRIRRVCDLGCGGGVLSLILHARYANLLIDAIDISKDAIELAEENMLLNGAANAIRLFHADIRDYRQLFEAGSYDLVITNPPYFPLNSGSSVSDSRIANAREELNCSIDIVIAAASYLLRWGGRFALVHRPERLSRILYHMTAAGIEPKRLRLVCKNAESLPSLILIEGKRGGNEGLKIEKISITG